MMKATLILISTLLAAVGINAAPSEPCYGPDGAAGVCLSSSECTSEGGKTIDGAGRIVEAWPGRIRRVYCARGCRCGEGSDHCCGKATDMMCSDAGGAATLAGRKVAEWVVRNRDELRLGYVIWGQKIWHVKKDKEMGWDRWRTMDDREDVTQNHWNHVHVSYR
ncbi:hypothetical protein ACKVWC_001422 [Pyricularia oryzae]|nr:hypothetical protein MCOR01_005524 [Pyricularia oryzae]KAI6380073.1 hypothetical protein MCOR32_004220 [Pyricularia oryzae]KAI6607446.1 hypothetical protein MCOR12_000408 [Pyricularia oryzae]